MAHDDTVIHADGVELEGNAAGGADGLLDDPPKLLQMHMAGNDVNVGVGHPDEGLGHIGVREAAGLEQGAMGRTFKTLLDDIGAHKNLVKVMDQMAVAGSRRRAGPLQDRSISPEPVQAKRGPAF